VLRCAVPQITDPTVMKSFIFQKGWVTPSTKKKREAEAANATLQVTGAVGWRKEGIRYKKNEVFLDVIETVSMLMSAQGSVLRCDVRGHTLHPSCTCSTRHVSWLSCRARCCGATCRGGWS
jgi:AP-2 complex subunit mu-1